MREGVKVVEVYNDGLRVYLYDESFLPQLKDLATPLVHGQESDALHKKAVKQIAAARMLVAYELYQDDSVRLGVAVGEPLSTKEKKGTAWRKPAASLLAL